MMQLRPFKEMDDLYRSAEDLLEKTMASPGALMLSGGSTPYTIYDRIAAKPCLIHPERMLFLSDERLVPLDSPDSNAGKLLPMLDALEARNQFLWPETDLAPEAAATRYEEKLQMLSPIDLGLLGLGADGHTAGLFTLEAAGLKDERLALHTSRPDGMKGLSVTPLLLRRIKRLILLVTGEAKRPILTTLLNESTQIPAGIILAGHPAVEIWTDLQLK